ncbi:MAG: ROK family protein [Acidobacteria bacterium]|nr:ROK family protein [Acidobacteriota bacterium]
MSVRAVCVELGGGGAQTVVFAGDGSPEFLEGAREVDGAPLLLAVPGVIEGRVVTASNLGWTGVDPVAELRLRGPARVLCNDAEAAALGESVLRELVDLAYLGLGTGIGGAVVRDGRVAGANLFGHQTGFGDRPCPCGRVGCLETVAAGWSLPNPVTGARLAEMAEAIAVVLRDPALPELVVVGGGIARRYPAVVGELRRRAAERRVEPSAAREPAKSAAAWGLLRIAGLDGARAAPAGRAAG